jgi:hypothetical protein
MRIATTKIHILLLLVGITLAGVGACSDDQKEVEHKTITGTISQIKTGDGGTGRVRMAYFHEKSGQYRDVEGDVDSKTEIFINGKLSTIQDLRIGEHATVQGRIETVGGARTITAIRIDVTRDETRTFGSGKP